uniref:Uncharacterized protein n=1 Tax=Rhizophora mucronata TaxID=61149 RepID=A0A2P2NRZ5_RHIMU
MKSDHLCLWEHPGLSENKYKIICLIQVSKYNYYLSNPVGQQTQLLSTSIHHVTLKHLDN